jgi:MFS transporter, CP family, cyanate transporter
MVLRFAVFWLAGIGLRVTILAVPPLLPLIHRDLALDEKAVGVLSGIPVLLLGLAALGGALIVSRLGPRRAIVVGLVTIATAGALRGIGPSIAMLFAMTFVMSAGVAIMQPALPSLVARWAPNATGLATAVYVNGLLVGETLGAGATLPVLLPFARGSWQISLALWSVPVIGTAALAALVARHAPAAVEGNERRWWPDWRDPRIWQLGLLQGGVSALYFGTNAFIPDYLHAIGQNALVAPALTATNAAQIPSSLALIAVAQRLAGRKTPLLVCVAAALCGFPLLLGGSPLAVLIGSTMIGLFGAGILTLALALPPLLAERDDVHRVAAGMFTVGYTFSFVVPIAGGVLWDATHVPATAFFPVIAGALAVAAGALVIRVER